MISSHTIREIKQELLQGDIFKVKEVLVNCEDPETLKVLREQKILFFTKQAVVRNQLAVLFKDAIKKACSVEQFEKETLYVDFALYVAPMYLEIEQTFHQEISKWSCNRTLKEILVLTNLFLEVEQKKLFDNSFKFISQQTVGTDDEQRAELNAFALHMFNARNNDISFALSNLVNTASKYCRLNDEMLVEPDHEMNVSHIQNLAGFSSEVVNYQWLIDKVSYGEWTVSKIVNCEKPEVFFQVADIRLEFAREIGIRGNLVSMHLGKRNKRWLHELLEASAMEFVEDALSYYQSSGRLLLYSTQHFKELNDEIYQFLDMLDAEDELLVGLNKKDAKIAAHYLFAISLVCFSRVASFCKKHMAKRHSNFFLCPDIPLERIQRLVGKYSEIETVDLTQVLANLTTSLPTLNHFDIILKPYVKTQNVLWSLSAFTYGNWAGTARAISYKGGEAANVVGNAWEVFLAETMRDYGWNVIGTSVKLERPLPDIDIVVTKENVLLLIQLKTIYGTGINSFEQWKSRERIINGAEQAVKVHKYVSSVSDPFKSVGYTKSLSQMKVIQPLVVTNVHTFNGWICQEVPVVSVDSLMQLLRGAIVNYMTAGKTKLSSKNFASTGSLSITEFLKFLTNPLDWRLSNEKIEIAYEKGALGDFVFHFPKIKRADGLTMKDVIPIS